MSEIVPTRKRFNREDKETLKRFIQIGLVAPDKPGKSKTTYSTRLVSEAFSSETYPGFQDHPSNQGLEYSKHIDLSPTASMWTALASLAYSEGGLPIWIRHATSDLDIAVYWQLVHYQMVSDGEARMSIRTLSRNLGRPYRSILRCMERLMVIGIITKVRSNTGRKPGAYKVVPASSIEPRVLPPRRIDSGFNKDGKIKEKAIKLEVTAGSIEVTAENRTGDRTDTQKTKPLKGLVSEYGASAPIATTKKKHNGAIRIQTIGHRKANREQIIKRQKYSSNIHTFRTFYPREVTSEILGEVIQSSVSLRKIYSDAITLDHNFGAFNQATGALEPGRWSTDPNKILNLISQRLISLISDVNQIAKAVERELVEISGSITVQAQVVEREFEVWKSQKAKKLKEEQEKEMFLLALEEEILRNRQEKLARLSKYREMLTFLLPDIIEQIEIWGAVGFISHHSGRTNGVYEIEEVLYFTLADLYGFSDWKSIPIVDQERLLKGLLTGNELVE